MTSYASVIQSARDRSPLFNEAVMDAGMAQRRLHDLAYQLTSEVRLHDPMFMTTAAQLDGGSGSLESGHATMFTAGIALTSGQDAEYIVTTGMQGNLTHAASPVDDPDYRVDITVVPWGSRLHPWGDYPVTIRDFILYPLGTSDDWTDVNAIYYTMALGKPATIPTNLVQPSTMDNALIEQLALAMALRAAGLGHKPDLASFATVAEQAKSAFLAHTLRTGRPRKVLVRDVMP